MQTKSRKRYVKMIQPGSKRGTFRLVIAQPAVPADRGPGAGVGVAHPRDAPGPLGNTQALMFRRNATYEITMWVNRLPAAPTNRGRAP